MERGTEGGEMWTDSGVRGDIGWRERGDKGWKEV